MITTIASIAVLGLGVLAIFHLVPLNRLFGPEYYLPMHGYTDVNVVPQLKLLIIGAIYGFPILGWIAVIAAFDDQSGFVLNGFLGWLLLGLVAALTVVAVILFIAVWLNKPGRHRSLVNS